MTYELRRGSQVQDWNARSRRLLSALGFVKTATHAVGDVTYVVYERDA